MDKRGFTLIELLIVIAIIGILSAVAVTAYIGAQKRADRTEAYTNLKALRLLQEQFFAVRGRYTQSADGVTAIQALLPGFQPGTGLSYSYRIEQNKRLDGTAQTPCFTAVATGIAGTRVDGDVFAIDCNNIRNF